MRYPIGIQTFSEIREGGYVYVDKTERIARLPDAGKYFFLSRPRRFGKSLLLSTYNELYSGSRELFDGLWAAEHWDFEARQRPVIWLQFASSGFRSEGLERGFHHMLDGEATKLGIDVEGLDYVYKFQTLIKEAAAKTSHGGVVLLIDEYDKPIVDYIDQPDLADANRVLLKSFYSVIKDADPYLEFVFITGVTAIAKVSIFSDLNNVRNITLDPLAHTLLGITEAEVDAYFAGRIAELPHGRGEVRRWYNGYSWGSEERVYNPWSLLTYLASGLRRNYWFDTGTPTWLLEEVRRHGQYELVGRQADPLDLADFDVRNLNPVSVLFQTGYLTIVGYDERFSTYTLDYPNMEVRQALELLLLKVYLPGRTSTPRPIVVNLLRALEAGDVALVIDIVDGTFAEIPYQLWSGNEREGFYHAIVYLLFRLVGTYVQAEVSTGRGRVDAVVFSDDIIYAIEFKLDRPVAEALDQIRERGYLGAYAADPRRKLALGVSFDGAARKVGDWRVEEV